MPTFTPPTYNDTPTTLPDSSGPEYMLMRHYGARPRGENVWKLPDGSYTQIQPWPLVTPADAAQGNLPLGMNNAVTYVLVYYGGHTYDVSDAEAAALAAAGYTVDGVITLPVGLRITEDGRPRITEDGRYRLVDA